MSCTFFISRSFHSFKPELNSNTYIFSTDLPAQEAVRRGGHRKPANETTRRPGGARNEVRVR